MKEGEKINQRLLCLVTKAGWAKKAGGVEEIYIPALRIFLLNRASEALNDVVVHASFELDQKRLCLDSARLLELGSGKDMELLLRCIETNGLAAIFNGLNLIYTAKKATSAVSL